MQPVTRRRPIETVSGLLAITAAYFVGGLPIAYVAGRCLRGVDIRRLSSRNVGSLNASQQLGVPIGLLVLAADVGKGALLILVARAAGLPEWALFGAATAVVIGHNWSPYIGFAGGKGVAVLLGVSLAMMPLLSLLAFPVVAAGWALTRSFVWAIAAGLAMLNVLVVLSGQPAQVVALCIALSAVVTATHLGRSAREIAAALTAGDLRRIGQIE